MRGNTSDKTTLSDMLRKIAERDGGGQRTWIMDRSIPTEEKAGCKVHRLVTLHLPAAGEAVTFGTFRFELDRPKLKAKRRHQGQYPLRSNLSGEDPAEQRKSG